MAGKKKKIPLLCALKKLPANLHVKAAKTAIDINPVNAPGHGAMAMVMASIALCDQGDGTCPPDLKPPKESKSTPPEKWALAALTTKYWGSGGVKLTVGFMDRTNSSLANRILGHMNAWNTVAGANVQFVLTNNPRNAQVRISRGSGGYWSYLGTDITHIPLSEQTMNLEGFTDNSDESEFTRVVRHETGHTLGYPHEHLRSDLVAKLDPQKTIAYFMRTQGWSEDEVKAQVLTSIAENSLLNPTPADVTSIMCYQLPGSITIDGKPIIGGTDLDEWDKQYARKIYPPATPPPPPPPPSGKAKKVITVTGDNLNVVVEDVPG